MTGTDVLENSSADDCEKRYLNTTFFDVQKSIIDGDVFLKASSDLSSSGFVYFGSNFASKTKLAESSLKSEIDTSR